MPNLTLIAMLIAERITSRSNCRKRQVAFVVFDDKEIIDVAVNEHPEQSPCQCVPGVHDKEVLHAEQILLNRRKCLMQRPGLKAVVTYAPCLACGEEIARSTIKTVYVREVKHLQGINHLELNNVEVRHQWLTPEQRIQAAWQMRWLTNLEEFY